ncbi:MAG: DUF599 family protein [Gammaproteobacteria bacterium]|nr:MAG: DUF599 family protein [Gammaproteobacteria bacterium]
MNWLDAGAVGWFFLNWIGYTWWAGHMADKRPCLSNALDYYRDKWSRRMLIRDARIQDAAVYGNLERNGAFFASSTLLILAGLLTAIGYADQAMSVFSDLPFVHRTTKLAWELKLALLCLVFVFAFFKFTWAMRQYNFCAVMVGGAPMTYERDAPEAERVAFVKSMTEVANLAGDSFNLGLRSYYYGLAVLTWFIHPVVFMAVTSLVVYVLYLREFRSQALKALNAGILENEADDS